MKCNFTIRNDTSNSPAHPKFVTCLRLLPFLWPWSSSNQSSSGAACTFHGGWMWLALPPVLANAFHPQKIQGRTVSPSSLCLTLAFGLVWAGILLNAPFLGSPSLAFWCFCMSSSLGKIPFSPLSSFFHPCSLGLSGVSCSFYFYLSLSWLHWLGQKKKKIPTKRWIILFWICEWNWEDQMMPVLGKVWAEHGEAGGKLGNKTCPFQQRSWITQLKLEG